MFINFNYLSNVGFRVDQVDEGILIYPKDVDNQPIIDFLGGSYWTGIYKEVFINQFIGIMGDTLVMQAIKDGEGTPPERKIKGRK